VGDVCNLDHYVCDAECEELIALDVIDFLPSNELDTVIDNWIRKLRHGGSITVGGVDMREVARGLVNQTLTMDRANILLYGAQRQPYEYRKSTLTMQKLLAVFQTRGLKVIQKRLVNYYYHVKAERP
jgi:hypothetical protein